MIESPILSSVILACAFSLSVYAQAPASLADENSQFPFEPMPTLSANEILRPEYCKGGVASPMRVKALAARNLVVVTKALPGPLK